MIWNCISRPHHFLKISANYVDSMFIVFMTQLKLCFKIFRKRRHRIWSNFAITEATKGSKAPLSDFQKKELIVPRKASKR